MTRALVTIHTQADRDRAAKWVMAAPVGMRVEFKQIKRSDEQNAKCWAMLSEVAAQCPWHGVKLTADDWKFVFLDALKRELRMVPNIDGTGFVNLGRSSSDLSKAEMSDLIELIHAFGAQHDIKFKDDSSYSNPSQLPQTETVEPAPNAPPLSGAGSPPSDAPALPQGWEIRLREALGRAQSPERLVDCARDCFTKLGAFPALPGDVETAKAIRAAFENNFGEANKESRENLLRELV